MRVGVIGNVNQDAIQSADGRRHQGLGGALYTVMALSRMLPGVEVLPLTRVGTAVLPAVRQMCAAAPCVRLDGLRVAQAENYGCRLQYRPDGGKHEVLRGHLPPLAWTDLADVVPSLTAVLVNFITGRECTLAVLQRVRRAAGGPVIMDLHSLLLASAAGDRRDLVAPHNWREWVAQADALQMNEAEACLVGGLRPGAGADRLGGLARDLLQLGPRWVAITRGAAGALAVAAGAAGAVHVPAYAPGGAVDTTGCGDVFLAAFGAGYVRGSGLEEALTRACQAAGEAARTQGPAALQHLTPLAPVAPDGPTHLTPTED